jgi:DNA-binding YbaB/EbfC family protein
MKDILGLMGKVKEMQARMQEMQEGLSALEVSGQSGGGLVKVTLNGKGDMRAVSIDPSLVKQEDAEMIEDLIVAAHNDAKVKVETMVAERTRELTAGLPIPPGMKLPF